MKKIVFLFVLTGLLCGLLSGCLSNSISPETKATKPSSQSSVTNPTTQPVTEPPTQPTTEPPTEPEETEPEETEPEETEPAPTAPPQTLGDKAVEIARAQLGKSYVYGMAGPDTFDASGLVQYCYQQVGVNLPRSTPDQAASGTAVEQADLKPGDAVFFWAEQEGRPEYVGIYIGGGEFIAASSSARPVSQINMTSQYYQDHFICARRFYNED